MKSKLRCFHVKFSPKHPIPLEVIIPPEALNPDGSITFEKVDELMSDEFPYAHLNDANYEYFSEDIKTNVSLRPKECIKEHAGTAGVVMLYINEKSSCK